MPSSQVDKLTTCRRASFSLVYQAAFQNKSNRKIIETEEHAHQQIFYYKKACSTPTPTLCGISTDVFICFRQLQDLSQRKKRCDYFPIARRLRPTFLFWSLHLKKGLSLLSEAGIFPFSKMHIKMESLFTIKFPTATETKSTTTHSLSSLLFAIEWTGLSTTVAVVSLSPFLCLCFSFTHRKTFE